MGDKTPSGSILSDIRKKPHKSPGQKRQRVVAMIVVAIITVIALSAYLLLIPKDNPYILKSFDSATATTGSMVRKIQAGGSVSIPLQVLITAPDIGDGAYVQELAVREGDLVEKDQVLVVLAVPSLEEQLLDLQEEYEEAMRSYEQFKQQNDFSEARLERELTKMDPEIEEAKLEVEKQRQLVLVNATRESDYERAIKTLESLNDSYEEKVIQLEETKIINKLNEQSKLSSLDRNKKNIARLEASIEDAIIRSPITGEILSVDNRLTAPGSTINKGQSLFTVADRNSAVIELEVPEQYAGLLAPEQQVSLSVGGKPLVGTIDTIGRIAVMSNDGITATVKVTVIPQQDSDLIPGSTAISEIVIGTLENILLLPRGPYLTTGGQRYVYVIEGDQAIKTAVTFGELQTEQVQILQGLSVGDEVIISGYQNFIEHNTIMLQGADK